MTTIGSLMFCGTCQNICPPSTGIKGNVLVCKCCGAKNPDTAAGKVITTESKPSDFPSPLRTKLSSVQVIERHKMNTEAKINVTCPKCGAREVGYTTAQLRSADEGTTVFYRCNCGHRWNENN